MLRCGCGGATRTVGEGPGWIRTRCPSCGETRKWNAGVHADTIERALARLPDAPAYLILRDRPWKRPHQIIAVRRGQDPDLASVPFVAAGLDVQQVRYRPDAEDLGPLEPNPWVWRAIVIGLVIAAICLALIIRALGR